MTEKLLLSYDEAAELTGLSDDTLQRAVNRNELKIVKIGRRTGIRPTTLYKWIEDNERCKFPEM